jgi:hypothetical protein
MSVWYDYKITAFGHPNDIAKFFDLDPGDAHFTESFDFSFGHKSGPGIRYEKIVKKNHNLVFLVQQSVECNPPTLWIEKYDPASNEFQRILIEDNQEINKRMLAEYEKQFPYLMEQHKNGRPYDWNLFCHRAPLKEYLRYFDSFQQMICPISEDDIEFDNSEVVDDD